jgi:hypothetical protein
MKMFLKSQFSKRNRKVNVVMIKLSICIKKVEGITNQKLIISTMKLRILLFEPAQ